MSDLATLVAANVAIADEATPGPWRSTDPDTGLRYGCSPDQWDAWQRTAFAAGMDADKPMFTVEATDERGGCTTAVSGNGPRSEFNAAHIAASDPDTLRALYAVVSAAADTALYDDDMGGDVARDALTAALDALKAVLEAHHA